MPNRVKVCLFIALPLVACALAGAGLRTGIKKQPVPLVLVGLSKDLKGEGGSKAVVKSECPTPVGVKQMLSMDTTLKFEVTSNAPCDEIKTKGVLTFHWHVIARADMGEFGTHEGTFTYQDSVGNFASGMAIGTVGCGTHRKPNLEACERCRVPMHFEGTLKGSFTKGPFFSTYGSAAGIHASYAGLVNNRWESFKAAKGELDGALFFPCHKG